MKFLFSFHELKNKDPQTHPNGCNAKTNGIINNVNTTNINIEFTNNVIKDPTQEVKLIEHVLQMYALNQLFFENLSEEKINRFNRTLNIQWAIDIKNQLPN